ncbi:MAG: helix-turn-helix transcriptional regulator [Lachnospiraceae bacterium]|nr:helix-turn-helix transcriptional regulator [Lachnospiraceae bacterium]
MTFYERLETLRKSKKISQGDLEKELGFSNGSISKWKKSQPTFDRLKKLADYFGVTVEYLQNGETAGQKQGYYFNEETAKLAQEMFEDPDMRSLFDMKRNMPPERFKAHMEFMKSLYKQETGEDI